MQRRFINSSAITQAIIYNISPTTTPFLSNVGKDTCDATYHEWGTDILASADGTNGAIEGADAVDTTFAASNRVGNYTQISQKTINVSGTSGATDAAGMKTLEAYLLAKRARELKRDMETILLSNQAGVVGSGVAARKLAGFPTWIASNKVAIGTTTAPTMSSSPNGYPNTNWTLTSGAAYATEANLKTVLQSLWTNGGEPRMAMVGPIQKTKYSAFTGIATNRMLGSNEPKQSFILGAADLYVSDFGNIDIVPNRFCDERFSYLIDPEYAKVTYLRPFQRNPLAKTGDSRRTQLLVEYTLTMNTEKAHGLIANQLNT
jgi:Family of unknown function (DUF5309)